MRVKMHILFEELARAIAKVDIFKIHKIGRVEAAQLMIVLWCKAKKCAGRPFYLNIIEARREFFLIVGFTKRIDDRHFDDGQYTREMTDIGIGHLHRLVAEQI